MSSYFYGLVQQRGPWATTDVDILRNTQPRVKQSVVERNINLAVAQGLGVPGMLAGNAGYGTGASYGNSTSNANSINGLEMLTPKTNPSSNSWGMTPTQEAAKDLYNLAKASDAYASWGQNSSLNQIARAEAKQAAKEGIMGNAGWGSLGAEFGGGTYEPEPVKTNSKWVPKNAEQYSGAQPLIINGAVQYDKSGNVIYTYNNSTTEFTSRDPINTITSA